MARARSLAFRLIVVAAVLCVVWAIAGAWVLRVLGHALIEAGEPVRADAVVVLAGDFFGNRILKGGELVRQGYAPKALVSGPWGYYGHYECEWAVPFATAHGYPAEYFVPVPHRARSTEEEAGVLLPVLRKMGVHRYLLVTSDYHTGRAGRIFRARSAGLEVHVVAAPDKYFSPDAWWRSREARKTFIIEWEKTLAAFVGM